jgi:hypothetical protein
MIIKTIENIKSQWMHLENMCIPLEYTTPLFFIHWLKMSSIRTDIKGLLKQNFNASFRDTLYAIVVRFEVSQWQIWRWLFSGILCHVIWLIFRGAYCLHHQRDKDYSHPDDGGSKILLNVSQYLPDYILQHSERQPSLYVIISQHTKTEKKKTLAIATT